MGIFSEIFSWWVGHLVEPDLHRLRGKLVGTDDAGNRYYVQSKGIGPLGVPRRWVIYANCAEASQVPRSGTAGCTTSSMRRRPSRPTCRVLGKSRTA